MVDSLSLTTTGLDSLPAWFTRRRRRCPTSLVTQTLKMLAVTFTNTLSASDHVRNATIDIAQSLYALRVLQHHGLGEAGLQTVFRAVVVSRVTHVAPAWIGFITGSDI